MNNYEKNKLKSANDWNSIKKQFLEENLELLLKGDVEKIEYNIYRIVNSCQPLDGFLCEDILKIAVLKELIKRKNIDMLRIFVERMTFVPVLEEIDLESIANCEIKANVNNIDTCFEIPKTPFLTDDIEIMKLLLSNSYEKKIKKTIWRDENRVYYAMLSPLAAVMATGNKELLEVLKKSDTHPFFEFYMDEGKVCSWDIDTETIPMYVSIVANELLAKQPYRLASPEEALLLSNNIDIIREIFDSMEEQEVVHNLTTYMIEFAGHISRHKVFKHTLSDSFYWTDAKVSRYMDTKFKELHKYYDFEKILESRNEILLESYLKEHENCSEEMLRYALAKISSDIGISFTTVGMLDEKVKRGSCHCIPINPTWMKERTDACKKLLIQKFS